MHQTNKGNEDILKDLSELFIKSPDEGISQSKQYLMSPNFTNYDEFIEDVKKTQKSNCCIVSWSKSMLSARCLDCQLQDNSCICIPCYLAGKHDQHHSYLIGSSSSGNCDCGDPYFWKPKGNCPNHPGPDANPEITQMTEENRTKFIKIFEIAYNSALTTTNGQFSIQIFDWLTSFISFGDGLRRCGAIAVTSLPEETFLTKLQQLEKDPFDSLLNLFGKLISDQYFSKKMGAVVLKNYLLLRNVIRNEILKDNLDKNSAPFYPIKEFLSFSFHFFNEGPLMYMVQEYNFDWVEFLLNSIKFIFDTFKQTNNDYRKLYDGQITHQMWYVEKILEVVMKKDDQHDNIQRFVDMYSSVLLEYERYYTFTFRRVPEDDDKNTFSIFLLFIYLSQLNCVFSPRFDPSPKNKTFSIDVTFSNLLKYLTSEKDIAPISLYGENPVKITSFLPLHHFFYCILSSHKNHSSVINDQCVKNHFSIDDFCCLSSICPLRILAAVFVPDRFSMLNNSSRSFITQCLDSPEETFNFFFGHVQCMLNVLSDKERFLSMIFETFGVYEDVQLPPIFDHKDKRRMMQLMMDYQNQLEMRDSSIFDASLFIVSLITDKSISTFDKVLFKRLRVIELLLNKKANAKEIEKYVDDKMSNPIFGDDLQSYAERVSTSNGSFFRIKDQSEFTPFFPVINRKNRMKIIMNYNDKLIPIPELFIDNPSECLSAPTFIAAMYGCLVNKSSTFNQVGLAMFVLAANYGKKYEINLQPDKMRSIEPSSISELVKTIENLFKQDQSFNPLLLNIELKGSKVQTSIIDAVKKIKKLGYEAFEKTNLPDILKPESNDDNDKIQKEKKARAAHLRQALMKEFQDKRSQFTDGSTMTANNDDKSATSQIEKNETSEILCNICQTKVTDDIIGFPCLSLPSIIPALISKKLHNADIQLDNLECVFNLSICMHHVHKKCFMNQIKFNLYRCVIDRSKRNCLLPLFPSSFDFSSKPSDLLLDACVSFVKTAFENQDPIVQIKSYAGIVLILEVRHRSRPECLDNPTVPSLLRNLLLTLYTVNHAKIADYEKAEPLEKLVIKLINSDSPKEQHKSFVKEISESLKGDDESLYEFLRRAAIIEDFALKKEMQNNSEKVFIDWDEILSFESLVKRYELNGVNAEIEELPPFQTIPLAERFVGLYQPPYNMDIFDSSYNKFVDLLTGNIVYFLKDETGIPGKPDIQHVSTYTSQKYHGGIAMFLSLTGPNASDIIICCPKTKQLFNLDGFYVDQFGDIDRGFKRGAILELSHDKLENALGKFLSGDIIIY